MNLDNVSLKWKIAVPIILAISIGIVCTITVTGIKTKAIVLAEIKNSGLEGYRDTVLNALTTMMITGNYAESKDQFLDQMAKIAGVRVLKSANVTKDFPAAGQNGKSHHTADAQEMEVMEKGIEKVVVEGEHIRGIYPYIARSDFMGKNCLTCHNVKDGDVLGAVSITLPLAKTYGRIRSLQYLYSVLGFGGIAGVMLLVVFMVGYSLRPLSRFMTELNEISSKYAGLEVSRRGGDEVAQVERNIKEVITHFTTMVNQIMVASSKFLPIIDILKDVVAKAAQGAQSQSAQATQIATAAEEMSQTINDIARNAASAAETSVEALDIASSGKEVADGSVGGVKEVHLATVALSTMMEELNRRVAEIGDIVTVIKDIADQTNLLALNAAIEAARAGEQGRGFSVVADEVRKLAERTIKATNEISTRIQTVQTESTQTAHSMAEATDKSTRTARHIGKVGDSLQAILSEIQKVKDEITKIAVAVEEQSATTSEVAQNIETTSAIARDIEEMAGKAHAEVSRLSEVADELRSITSGVKTKGGAMVMLELAKSDHRNFVGKISSCLKGELPMEASKLPDHHTCRFGKWYDSAGSELCGNSPSFGEVSAPHEKIHELSKQAVAAFNSGDKQRAAQIYEEVVRVSGQIITIVDRIKEDCAKE
ncbi:MAG: methyl-accepting chemotaxis protein [Nitrospiraceae bacterium]|nr:methyl-accepting chemotaxis protein [Nitrospiraceae bacterium]